MYFESMNKDTDLCVIISYLMNELERFLIRIGKVEENT